MRAFLATPFLLTAKVFAFMAAVVSGRPITCDWPMTLDEAVEAGLIDANEARRIMAQMEEDD